jgi:hypothetical protein
MSSLTPALPSPPSSTSGTSLDVASVRDHLASAALLAGRAPSEKTLDAYRADWARIVDYCRTVGVDPRALDGIRRASRPARVRSVLAMWLRCSRNRVTGRGRAP